MSCDYQSVLAASKCFECIPQGIQLGIHTSLLNEISGANLSVDQLIANARCIASCIPPGMLDEVKTRLLCERVDTLTGSTPLPPINSCTNALVDAPVTGWVARVAANGGVPILDDIRYAMCVFANGLDAAGLTSKMISVNCVAPNGLIAAITPLIVGPGNNPWTNTGPFVEGDLDQNGLKANGIGKYLKTGVNPNTAFANNTNAGVTIYNMTALNAATVEIGAQSGVNILELITSYTDAAKNCYFDCYDFVNRIISPNPLWTGYLSANRTAANAAAVYKASDTVPFQTLGSIAAGGGTRPNLEIYAFGINQGGALASPSSRRLSFIAIHLGLTSAQSQQLYNLVRALRGSFQGGFV